MISSVTKSISAHKLTLAIAETSTGGMIANILTDQAGASAFFNGSIVAYSYDSLRDVLHVKPETLDLHGAVSEATVREMAQSVRQILNADIGIGICGITGPSGGTVQKPVGTSWLAISDGKNTSTHRALFDDDRIAIKTQMAQHALACLADFLEHHYPGP